MSTFELNSLQGAVEWTAEEYAAAPTEARTASPTEDEDAAEDVGEATEEAVGILQVVGILLPLVEVLVADMPPKAPGPTRVASL